MVDGLLLPLNADAYTLATAQNANSGPYVGTLGVLGAAGGARCKLVVPAGLGPSLAGLSLAHAYVAFGAKVELASNAVWVVFVP
jgi:hypothetical protein